MRCGSLELRTLLVLKVEELLVDLEQVDRQPPDSESALNQQVRNGWAMPRGLTSIPIAFSCHWPA
jgi:hypothetical protein